MEVEPVLIVSVNMTYFTTSIICLLLTVSYGLGETDDKEVAVEKSNNAFTIDIYNALRNPDENIFVSPLSLQIVLAMAQQGANGTTADEIGKTLHQEGENQDVLEGYKGLVSRLRDPVLNLATEMFLEKTFSVFPRFRATLNDYFFSGVQEEDFKNDPEESRLNINKWVENNTNDKIKDLLVQGSIDDKTKLILVNAIHFKADWKKAFPENNTIDEPFYVKTNEVVIAKMMAINGYSFPYSYNEKLKAQVLELPYNASGFSMLVFLPDNVEGLNDLENQLENIDVSEVIKGLRKQEVDVYLPPFKIEKTIDFNSILQKLGVVTAFTSSADFSNLSDTPVAISGVVQKAFIEVNEKGTEAAAATAVSVFLALPLVVPEPVEMRCNHPFVYMIMKGNTIIFIGNHSKPGK